MSENKNGDSHNVLTKSSRTTIGAACAVASVVLTLLFYMNSLLSEQSRVISAGQFQQKLDIQALLAKIDTMSQRIDRAEAIERRVVAIEREGTEAVRAWIAVLRASNPTMSIPTMDSRK